MNAFPSKFFSDNRRLAILSPKWGVLFALGVILTLCGAIAEGQQPTKVPRIGYLSATSPSVNPTPHRGISAGDAGAWVRGGEKHYH
jgi:hypothetical protein